LAKDSTQEEEEEERILCNNIIGEGI